jgi:formate dehydrogenase subunit gamma
MANRLFQRFTFVERIVHWVVGGTFVLLLATGLAFAYPPLFWLTALLGGGPSARALHPWVGVVFGIGMAFMIAIWIRDMFLSGTDRRWLRAIRAYATRDTANVPPAGKYNAGQKMFFWVQGVLAIVFVVSGAALWFPAAFGAAFLQWMRLAHYAATLGGGLFLIIHVYLGTVAYPGTARAMIDGTVTERWARHHHPRWHEDQTRT